MSDSVSLSPRLWEMAQSAAEDAARRSHAATSLEHVLLAVARSPDGRALLAACGVDVADMERELDEYLGLIEGERRRRADVPGPDVAYDRVLQRAASQVVSSGKTVIEASHLLGALLRERETYAAMLFHAAGIDRVDVLRVISHGTRHFDLRFPPGASRLRVILHNDDYTTMEFVVKVLEEHFGLPPEQAQRRMMEVHTSGVSPVTLLAAADAMALVDRVHATAAESGFPLRCSLQPA